ncbi:MAG: hypothetical protein QOD99_766 [Chthoniobacter sp.]|nr:hypothetical protein [Chthoniobacter sp.]
MLVIAASVQAQTDEKQWHVLIEPKFMHPEVSFPIPGAERTVFVPGYVRGSEVRYFSKTEFAALKLDWPAFRAKAGANVSDKKVKAEFVRNGKKVIDYATISSADPLTATAVLSPDFLKTFSDIFGAKLLVAIPNRFTVFVFPSLATNYRDYAPMIIEAYRAIAYPVSLEVFELSGDGLRAIGTFEE